MDKKCVDVIVIGAGASGMSAAVTAARAGARVLLLEQTERAGKKLLATGNGKCNYTNEKMSPVCFRGNAALLETVLSQFGKEEAVSFFREIGIFPKIKRGCYYPRSEQAISVVSAFLEELQRCRVAIHTNTRVISLEQGEEGWLVGAEHYAYRGKSVIFASGLLASPQFGSDGSCFPLLEKLGHGFTPMAPALCGFVCTPAVPAGVRAEARVELYVEGAWMASDTGEVQFTDYGVSGIPVFQVSRFAALALNENRRVVFRLAFLPDIPAEEIWEEICRRYERASGETRGSMFLNGLLPQKLIPFILRRAGLGKDCRKKEITDESLQRLWKAITCFQLTAIQARDYEYAQVCAGGIRSEEVDFVTLESKKAKGIYFCGELLDVDGICGGYNLQWAWSSGYVAGLHSAKAAGRKML